MMRLCFYDTYQVKYLPAVGTMMSTVSAAALLGVAESSSHTAAAVLCGGMSSFLWIHVEVRNFGKYLPIEYDDKYLLTKVYYVVLVFGRYFLFCYTTPQQ